MSKKYWTKDEVCFLQRNYGKIPIQDLAIIFNTTYLKVVDKAHKLGLNSKITSGEIWSLEEDELLKQHFEYAPKNRLIKLFSNRTWVAILQRGIKTLSLHRQSQDRYDVDYNFFETWTAESAYVFGFIASDGHLFYEAGKDNKNALQFEMAEHDRDILEKIKAIMYYEGSIYETKRNTVKLQINNKKIIKDLIAKGIPTKNKTFSLKYPETLPGELLSHFLRGIFDGDGSIYRHGRYFRIQLLGTYELLNGIKSRVPVDLSLNSICNRKHYGSGGADVCVLAVAGLKAVELAKYLYKESTIYSERKYQKYVDLLFKLLKNNKD